ncbi:hypothetical protein K492DRAFT_233355, partial [Lichtheimia hyalospora FSU 10163]
MTLSPELNPMRTRSQSRNTVPDANETFNLEQIQPPLDNSSTIVNNQVSSDTPDLTNVDNGTAPHVTNEATAPPPALIYQQLKNDGTIRKEWKDGVKQQHEAMIDPGSINTIADDTNVRALDTTELPKPRRSRTKKPANKDNIAVSSNETTLNNITCESNASVDMLNSVTNDDEPKEKEHVDSKMAQVNENDESNIEESEKQVKKRPGRKRKTTPADSKTAQVNENEESNIVNAEEPEEQVKKRPGRKRKTAPATTSSTRAQRKNTSTDTKQSTPIEWTLAHLLHHKDSMLTTAINLKNNITMDLINKLPEQAQDELVKLLPPADIDFIKLNDDTGTMTVAQSLDEHERLSNQPDTHKPVISQRLINPSFTQAVEDFQVNLQQGYYDDTPKPATGRGRKRTQKEVQDQDDFKDENFEAYWGERIKKRSKRGGRR